jgi:hypothetical protein
MNALAARLVSYGVPEKYAKRVRRRIGYGTEGAVYDLTGGKVLKVNVMAPRRHSVEALYRRLKGRSWAARMGEHGSLKGRGFWYVAPKLYPLSRRDAALLDDIGMMYLRHRSGRIQKALYEEYVRDRLEQMPEGLARVVRAARRAGYRDIHGANVMRTRDGKFKVIDVESVVRGKR